MFGGSVLPLATILARSHCNCTVPKYSTMRTLQRGWQLVVGPLAGEITQLRNPSRGRPCPRWRAAVTQDRMWQGHHRASQGMSMAGSWSHGGQEAGSFQKQHLSNSLTRVRGTVACCDLPSCRCPVRYLLCSRVTVHSTVQYNIQHS